MSYFDLGLTSLEEQSLLQQRDQLMKESAVAGQAAAIPDLYPVTSSVVSGVTVWTGTPSMTIASMKRQINYFGAGLDINVMVGPKTTSALKQVVQRYSGTGGVLGAKLRELQKIADAGEQQVARRARVVEAYVADVADNYGFHRAPPPPPPKKPKGEGGKATIPPPPPNTIPPPPPKNTLGAVLKSPIGLAAMVVGGVLIYRRTGGGKKGKR